MVCEEDRTGAPEIADVVGVNLVSFDDVHLAGEFSRKVGASNLIGATMEFVQARICQSVVGWNLSQAIALATRYHPVDEFFPGLRITANNHYHLSASHSKKIACGNLIDGRKSR